MQVKATTNTKYTLQDNREKARYIGMPTIVPAVPGAKGTSPLPNPVARNLINRSNRRAPLLRLDM
jgi:hypothetical protein